MQESFSPEHGRELFADSLEELLGRRRVADEGRRHLETPVSLSVFVSQSVSVFVSQSWRDVTDGRLDVVRDPLDEVRGILVLDVEHLFVNLLHAHAASEHGRNGEVSPVTRIAGGHDVFGVEHLLDEFGDGEGTVLLTASGGEGREAGDEEVKTRERDHVHRQLPEIRIQLTGESQTRRDPRHSR